MGCTSAAPSTEPTQEPSSAPTTGAPTDSPTTTPAPVTSASPTLAPTFEVCDTNDSLNIGFLMDESGSVSSSEWDVMVDFVKRIATFDVAGPSYVSLWEFASLVAFDHFLDFTKVDNDRSGITTVSDALDANNYNAAGTTETWDAVNRVMDEFFYYRKNCTDGCDTRNDLLFVLTDGNPTTMSGYGVCPALTPRVTASGIDIVLIAVGESEEDIDEWLHNVTCLDTNDNQQDVFKVTEFTDAAFRELEGLIRNKTCNGLNPAGESDRGGTAWVYEDGSTGLGPVPTASGDGNAPVDPDGVSYQGFAEAMQALVQNEFQKEAFEIEEEFANKEDESHFNNDEVSLSPFTLVNLWAMIVLALCVNGALILYCLLKRKRNINTMERDWAESDVMVETEVDF